MKKLVLCYQQLSKTANRKQQSTDKTISSTRVAEMHLCDWGDCGALFSFVSHACSTDSHVSLVIVYAPVRLFSLCSCCVKMLFNVTESRFFAHFTCFPYGLSVKPCTFLFDSVFVLTVCCVANCLLTSPPLSCVVGLVGGCSFGICIGGVAPHLWSVHLLNTWYS